MCGLSRATTSRSTILNCLIRSGSWPSSRLSLMARSSRSMRKGALSFQLLQLFKSSGDVPLVYYAFDLLSFEGKDLRKEPLTARRKRLAQVLEKAPENIRLSGELRGTKDELIRVAQEFGLEGLVAKKPNSVYESGRRSGAWVKFKITKSQEFVIGGYTLPEGARSNFGSLLVGYHSPDGLKFAGRVGTGFLEKTLAALYGKLQKLKQASADRRETTNSGSTCLR